MKFTSPMRLTAIPNVAQLNGRPKTASLMQTSPPRNALGKILAGVFALGAPGLALAAECANGSYITGSVSCTVPAGTSVTVEAWGAGGGGGAGSENNGDRFAGGGGGGGSYCKATFSSGGSALSLNITAGVGGTGGTSPAGGPLGAATAGGDSTVAGIGFIDLSAAGGTGGAVNATASSAGGGAGGTACSGVTTGAWVAGFAGGAGGHASAADGFGPGGSGGGGASASDASVGNDGSAGDAGSSGGISSEGGSGDFPGNDRGGGNGAQSGSPSNLDAQPGVSPGGGGGGGMYSNLVEASRLGASGAGGAVRLTWTPVPVGAPPTATTGAATGVTTTGVTLNGMVNDNGADTAVSFDYGANITYGTNVAATTGATVLAGSGSSAAAKTLTGLACNNAYHFRIVGSNSAGTTNGSDASFTTSACTTGPSVTTSAASSVGQTGATLNGSVSDVGANVSAIAYEYGTTTGYGSSSPASTTSITASAGSPSTVSPTAALTGLSCGTTYHFRIKATDASATNSGSDATFTTTACSSGGGDSGGGTVISGGSGTLSGGGSGTLTGPASVTVAGNNSTLDASSSSASGSTINVGASSSVSIGLGGNTPSVSVASGSGGAVLGLATVASGSGTQNVLSLSSGSASISSTGGSILLAVGAGSSTQLVAGSGGATINATAGAQGGTTVTVTSGTVNTPRKCGTRPIAPTSPPPGSKSAAWSAYFNDVSTYQRALLSYSLCLSDVRLIRAAVVDAPPVSSGSLLLYQGETIAYNSVGNEAGITLADGGAGVPQAPDFRRYGFSLESLPVSIDGTPARLKGANLGSRVVDEMGAMVGEPLKRQSPNTPLGGIAMAAADGTQVTSVPVGPLRVSPDAAGGLQASGLVRIVADGVVVDLAPSLASAGVFANHLLGLDSQASIAITANGVIKAAVGGAKFVLRPAWAASPGTLNGFSFDQAGRLVFGDGRMQQTLYPAFANVDALAAALSPIAGTAPLKMALDGAISISIGGTGYRMRAGYQLITTPEAHADDTWWLDGSTFYLNNHDGTAQPFTLE